MAFEPSRAGLSGPALIRLLTRLTGSTWTEPRQTLADRLSLWLGWSDAITLSTALNSAPPAVAAPDGDTDEQTRLFQRDCDALRTRLLTSIEQSGSASANRIPDRRLRSPSGAPRAELDYPVHGQRYVSMQKTMESDIASLRGHLRAALARRSPAMTKLAILDALMERTLAPRERSLLSKLPSLLESHFLRLSQAGGIDAPERWLAVFRQDMRSVMKAELALRMQPIDGLMGALRAPTPLTDHSSAVLN